MKKLFVASIIICIGLVALLGQHVEQAYGRETLKIIQDQFEFRDAPRVAEETLLGTLRINTPVEWTGKTSGQWFEVKAPNGQVGWVHASGLSQTKTRVIPTPTPKPKRTPRPKATPESQTSRKTSRPTTTQTAKLETTVEELQKTNEQYEAQLNEKTLRISELSKSLEELEDKLADTAQMIEDTEQRRQREEAGTITEVESLKQALKEKEEALYTEKLETAQLRNQLTGSITWERPLLYMLSIPLNVIALLILGFVGIRHMRHRKREAAEIEAEIRQKEEYQPQEGIAEPAVGQAEVQEATVVSAPSAAPEEAFDVETGLKDLDVVMATPASPQETAVSAEEEVVTDDEEVVIDLSDVLPAEKIEEPLETPEKIVEVALEELQEISEEPEIQEAEITEISAEPGDQEAEETELELVLEEVDVVEVSPESQELIEQEETEIELQTEEVEELISQEIPESPEPVEVIETDEPIIDLSSEDFEPTPEEIEQFEGSITESVQEEEEISSDLDKHMEELLEDTSKIEQDAGLDEILEEGELEEKEVEEEPDQEVEVYGETFEMLTASNTQIIEMEEEEEEEEEISYEAEGGRALQVEEQPAEETLISEKKEETEEAGSEEQFESVDEQVDRDFEPEGATEMPEPGLSEEELLEEELLEEELLEELIGEEESLIEEEELETETAEVATPSLLEPSPILIEPEYEPEEPTTGEEMVESAAEGQIPLYDIELIDVGNQKDQIVTILSKIKGLTQSPQELVDAVPCVIVRGATESDAKNFQVLMEEFGSNVRLIPKK